MLLVCYSLLNSQNISISNGEKRLVTYFLGHLRRQKVALGGAITGALTGKRSNNWLMVSFIHNRNEITWGIASKPYAQNPKQISNTFKIRTSLLNLKLQINRLAQGRWSCTPTQ